MTGPFAERLFRIAFATAGLYNLAFGAWASLWPLAFFQLFAIPPPRYPGIWACVGMIVGVYGLLYLYSAWKLEAAWPIIAVGLLGKVLGPIGMFTSFSDEWPRRLGMLCVTNDLIWWLPFGLFLLRGTRLGRRVGASAPWICLAVHAAAIVMLGVFLRHGTRVAADPLAQARYVGSHLTVWSIGWALWMAAAASLVGFYAWWGGKIGGGWLATSAVVLTACGMVCDFSGEGSALLRMVEHVSAFDRAAFSQIERQFTWLSAGAANGLYTLGGAILTLLTPNVPRWVRWAMGLTWLAAAAMTVAAVVGSTGGLVVATVIVFPLLSLWVAWMGLRWRPA